MANSMTYLRHEPAPPGSLLRGETVVYRDTAGKLWRCKPAEWERMQQTLKQVQVLKKLARKRA